MFIKERLYQSWKAALVHLCCSALIAISVGAVVFLLWYPPPYDMLAGGRDLFKFIILVDVIVGPFLTLIIFDKNKSRRYLWIDFLVIVSLQVVALGYGLYSVMQARPLYLAYEGDRYRVVSVPDIDVDSMVLALPEFASVHYGRPKLIGVRLSKSTEKDFPLSIQLSIAGMYPAYRPQRWVPYQSQIESVKESLVSIKKLTDKYPEKASDIFSSSRQCVKKDDGVGYLPLSTEKGNPVDWVVLVNRETGFPCEIIPFDGW